LEEAEPTGSVSSFYPYPLWVAPLGQMAKHNPVLQSGCPYRANSSPVNIIFYKATVLMGNNSSDGAATVLTY
jgi:hypothetical protein